MKLIFFGTGTFAVPIFEVIATKTDWQILAVLSAEVSPVGQKAKELGLKIFVSQQEILEQLPDIIVSADYGKIIPAKIFNAPPFKTVNIHPSLLPQYRGPSPIQWALLEGRDETGVTLILIDEELDHGPILGQERLPVAPDDTYLTLEPKLAIVGSEILTRDLARYVAGELKPKEQDHRQASYTKKITKEDGHIDWGQSAAAIYNRWRAFVRWPGIYTFGAGKRLNLTKIRPQIKNLNVEPGTVVTVNKQLLIQCEEGAIEILEIQPEGKRPMNAREFINGYRWIIGSRL